MYNTETRNGGNRQMRVATDIGGTFTDLVAIS